MYDIESYHHADSVTHAVALLVQNPEARLLAGGTDVLIELHHLNPRFRHIVDIHDLPELRGVTCSGSGHIRIGSGTTFSELIDHPLVQQHLPALTASAAVIAGPQIRNVATYGGNICNGATSADSACPSLIYETELEIATPQGTRFTSINGFHTGPGKVALEAGELLVAFHFKPENYRNKGAASFKYAMRNAMDISTIGCSALCEINAGRFREIKLAFGVAAPTPVRCAHAEQAAIGQPLTQETLAAIAEAVTHDVSPRTSWRAEKAFRLHLISTLSKRVIEQAVKQAGGEIQ
ncbi:xanthine dehydrogenase FAD-binding subunit XdhB [Buttiauxella sp. B2]|uniref:xanthine dehydrogenase FAD-binding subunit XdhB n=1 Tax=Buttiauxella sp. B2 TaxID=2587812 RepID=UPI001120CFA3|nr:xanthine dehydrogenase FAD-binding subunit XdhB [Buttiauxella sp. B2]TNV21959.1 xanthine dehydrogenase FAD-binding subunit XdhB [Buttiauxella sp. B2]